MRICIPKKIRDYGFEKLSSVCRWKTSDWDEDTTSMSWVRRIIFKVCRFRRCLCCACAPILLMMCLGVYVTIAVCLSMAPSRVSEQLRRTKESYAMTQNTVDGKFTAPGLRSGPEHAALPKTFWRSKLEANNTGLWNRLQYKMDLLHSSVLNSGKSKWQRFRHRRKLIPMLTKIPGSKCVISQESLEKALPDFQTLPFHVREFIPRMLCQDFPLILDQPGLCQTGPGKANSSSPFLLLAIKSQDENYEQRRVIRDTWGKTGQMRGMKGRGGLVRRVFLLAKSGVRPNRTQEELLQVENKQHGDLLRWDFKDTFFNLTLKDVLFWRWLAHRCPHAQFVFKGDDDVFLRTPALLDYLREAVAKEEEKATAGLKHDRSLNDFLVGDVIALAQPIREKDNKYYIPESLYSGTYPTYAGGGGVVYSGALAMRLQAMSERVRPYPIDDVYVGMCLERLGVIPKHEPAFLTFDFPEGEEEHHCAYHSILLVHKRSPEVVRRLWAQVLDPPPECRNTSLRLEPTPKPPASEEKAEDAPKVKVEIVKKDELDIMDLM
ncbi:N-acetyllactosaminide beta-1,3-N-acetylglucosaminyltransferase 2 [Engraulis encrasicolus]|uniref:N-acetyllactosaminide beta-1,3-N-acetylglucosaminyltransferase 2 n=1 Tax=Engraulis encrasicolus TaxID=184585 RepID=UPI002FD53E2C